MNRYGYLTLGTITPKSNIQEGLRTYMKAGDVT
jgi:hypothetical protein